MRQLAACVRQQYRRGLCPTRCRTRRWSATVAHIARHVPPDGAQSNNPLRIHCPRTWRVFWPILSGGQMPPVRQTAYGRPSPWFGYPLPDGNRVAGAPAPFCLGALAGQPACVAGRVKDAGFSGPVRLFPGSCRGYSHRCPHGRPAETRCPSWLAYP